MKLTLIINNGDRLKLELTLIANKEDRAKLEPKSELALIVFVGDRELTKNIKIGSW